MFLASVLYGPTETAVVQPARARVVYLGADGATSADGLVSAEQLASTFGAVVVSTWEQLVVLNDEEPIDALIIHRSALEQVDNEWVAHHYRQGVTMVGIDIDGAEMAVLLQDNCLTRDGFADYDSGSYFIIATSLVTGSEADVASIIEAYNISCGDQPALGIVGHAEYSARYTTEFFSDKRSVEIFNLLFLQHLSD
jgi:hypothetical protein